MFLVGCAAKALPMADGQMAGKPHEVSRPSTSPVVRPSLQRSVGPSVSASFIVFVRLSICLSVRRRPSIRPAVPGRLCIGPDSCPSIRSPVRTSVRTATASHPAVELSRWLAGRRLPVRPPQDGRLSIRPSRPGHHASRDRCGVGVEREPLN